MRKAWRDGKCYPAFYLTGKVKQSSMILIIQTAKRKHLLSFVGPSLVTDG